MEKKAFQETIASEEGFPVIARRTLIKGPQIIFGGHYHSQFELLYIKRGRMELCCNQSDYILVPGEAAVLNPYDIHTAFNGAGRLFYYCVIVDPLFLGTQAADVCMQRYIQPMLQGTLRFHNKLCVQARLAAELETVMTECRRRKPGYELAVRGALTNILAELYRTHLDLSGREEEREARRQCMERFRTIFLYLEEHYGDPLSLQDLASLAGYSPFHFDRLFHALTGKTPMRYLRALRLQKAAEMLCGGTGVSETALRCGFNSPNYFCEVFRREFGYPPRAHEGRARSREAR